AAMPLPWWLVLLASLVPPALGSWGVTYPESLRGVRGSCVVVPCTLSYPTDVTASDGIVAIWYKDYDNQKTVVYHSAAQEVDARFKGRAQLLGDPAARNCTLLLQGVTPEDGGPYRFRFEIINDPRPRPPARLEEQTEGQMSTLECSTPYVCPLGDVALRWEGYDPQVSTVSSRVQLDTSGVGHNLTLTTSFSWKDHSKKLLCEQDGLRQHPAGPAQPHRCLPCLSVLPADAPKDTHVSVSPSTQNIRVGDTVSLTCELSSSYPPISAYRWYKDGVAVGSERMLTLRGVRREDYGQYRCEAKNAVGAGVAPAVTLYIFCKCQGSLPEAGALLEEETVMPPSLHACILHPSWRRAVANPKDRAGRDFQPSPGSGAGCKASLPLRGKVVRALGDSEPGWFVGRGSQAGGAGRLPPEPPVQTTRGEGRCCTRHEFCLWGFALKPELEPKLGKCRWQGANPNASRLHRHPWGGRGAPASPWTLFCAAGVGGLGEEGGCSPAAEAILNALPSPSAAEISVSPAAEVREGTATTLSCDVPGREGQDLNYTWYKNSAWLKEGTAHTLLFHHVAASDAGYYSCKVTNDRGSDTSQAVTPDRDTQGGRLAIVRCAVDSHPPAAVALYRDGTLLAASGSQAAPRQRFGVTASRNALRLEIRGVGPQDSGEYRCTASNAYGNASTAKLFDARGESPLLPVRGGCQAPGSGSWVPTNSRDWFWGADAAKSVAKFVQTVSSLCLRAPSGAWHLGAQRGPAPPAPSPNPPHPEGSPGLDGLG
uniref:Sialic acid binding Ig like lectin 1 n=1 Tax=Aquila chrysaetos chrysaetos TaxID=223781 RepID=A0A663DJH6_AQUCH